MTEEMYKKCNYRFKGNSCKECPLGCIGKIDELTRLKQENFALTQESQQKSQTICDLKQENEAYKSSIIANLDRNISKRYAELLDENKELKKQIESQKGLITVGGKQQYEMTMAYDKCKTALEEINLILDELKQQYNYMTDYSEIKEIQDKINEVLNESK